MVLPVRGVARPAGRLGLWPASSVKAGVWWRVCDRRARGQRPTAIASTAGPAACADAAARLACAIPDLTLFLKRSDHVDGQCFRRAATAGLIERIERLEEDKKGIADDIKDVYAESKSNGYDTKTMRKIVALRKMDKDARMEADALLETYRVALGMAD